MKNIKPILIVLSLTIFQQAFAQKKIYLGKDWKKSNQENAHFYRILEKKNDSLYYVEDFYISGVMQMDGHFTNVEKETLHGTINWYDKDGQKTITKNYQNGKLHGAFINYSKDGSVFSKGSYKDGKPYSGNINDLCGNPVFYSNYKEGIKLSETVFYKDSNIKALERFFSKKLNRYNNYYPTSEVFYDKDESTDTLYYVNKSHMIDYGTRVSFYIDNAQATTVKKKETYKDSQLHGEAIVYHKNGDIWLKGIYKNNKKHQGDFLESFIKTSFENGIPVGNKIKYDKDFNVVSKLSYKDGKPYEGVFSKFQEVLWYEKGKLTLKKEFHDYKQQNIKKITTFKDEKASVQWYDEQGNLIGTGTEVNNRPFGGLHVSYRNLTLYKEGRLHGIEKKFKTDKKQQLLSKTLYQNDTIVWVKTAMPLKNDFFHCDYKDNMPFKGVKFEYATEIHYENAKHKKKVYYRKNSKTDELTLERTEFFDITPSYPIIIKSVSHKDGKTYTTTFKNHVPYDGLFWRDSNTFTSYKDGKKEGLYRIFEDGKLIEEGYHVNDKIHGTVHYTPVAGNPFKSDTPTSCVFDKGNPIDGIVSNPREITPYKDGKKHDVRTTYYYANSFTVQKITYKNGVKEGNSSTSIEGKKVAEGIYKDDKPYSGNFYNLKTLKIETFLDGKKHGLFVEEFNYQITQTKKYDKGELLTEKTLLIHTDSILGKGFYKNNKPYQGTFFQKLETYNQYLIESYEKGKKHGIAQVLFIDYKGVQTLSSTPYKKGKKHGAVQGSYIDKTSLQKIKVNGIYKKDKPYSGSFITQRTDKLLVLSNYKKGKKEGVEKYITRSDTYNLLYKNGEIVEGVQLELLKEKYRNRTLKHHYTDAVKTKTTFRRGEFITYNENGFVIDNAQMGLQHIKVSVTFTNTKKTVGSINYFQDGEPIGGFQFKNGKLKGKVKHKENTYTARDFFTHIIFEAKEDRIEMTLYPNKKIKLLNKIITPNKIPKNISYKDAELLMSGFIDMSEPNITLKYEQYLLDGNLLTTAEFVDGKKTGTLISFKENSEGEIRYSIRHQDKETDKKNIDNLSFEEMLEELKKLKNE